MTVTLIALAAVSLFALVIVQSLALATAAARGDELLRRAVERERKGGSAEEQRGGRRVAA
jgi:hypothetical protein